MVILAVVVVVVLVVVAVIYQELPARPYSHEDRTLKAMTAESTNQPELAQR